jgi:hypothetical protein
MRHRHRRRPSKGANRSRSTQLRWAQHAPRLASPHGPSLTVRAARPTAEDKDQAWRAILIDQIVPIGSIGAVAQAFWRPGQDAVLRRYPQRFLDALPELGNDGMIFAQAVTGTMFPVTAFNEDFLYEVNATLASNTLTSSVANRATAPIRCAE